MTKNVYRTAQGKMLDMGSLVLQNENVRAVGNMNVNARGDIIDNQDRVLATRGEQVNRNLNRTTSAGRAATAHELTSSSAVDRPPGHHAGLRNSVGGGRRPFLTADPTAARQAMFRVSWPRQGGRRPAFTHRGDARIQTGIRKPGRCGRQARVERIGAANPVHRSGRTDAARRQRSFG